MRFFAGNCGGLHPDDVRGTDGTLGLAPRNWLSNEGDIGLSDLGPDIGGR